MDDRKEICDPLPMVDVDVESRMGALRKRLLTAVKVQGLVTYKQLSLALNQNETFIQQFVTKKSPKRLFDDQIEIIEGMIEAAKSGAKEQPAAPAIADADLVRLFDRLSEYPKKLHERIISFAEFEMSRYDQAREKEAKPDS